MPTVEALRSTCTADEVFLVGRGPSLDDFPRGRLESGFTIALNRAVEALPGATIWLFGDPKFSKKEAKAFFPSYEGTMVCNEEHLPHIQRHLESHGREDSVFTFTNQGIKWEGSRGLRRPHWLEDRDQRSGFLPGRWTVATIGLSLAALIGVRRLILVGIDLGDVEGEWYAKRCRTKAPGRQADMAGMWRRWVQAGFRKGLWPIDEIVTASPHTLENCPGLPIKEELCW